MSNTEWPSHGSLREIRISELFGRPTETQIVLNRGIPTVLTGPNGSGKSTILRIVHACGKPDLGELLSIEFSTLTLIFEAGDRFLVIKDAKTNRALVQWREHRTVVPFDERVGSLPEELRKRLADDPDYSEKLLRSWDRTTFRSYDEYRHWRQLLSDMDPQALLTRKPDWLEEFSRYFPVGYISDRRLLEAMEPADSNSTRYRDASKGHAITAASSHIADTLRLAQARYGRDTDRVDRRLPELVIEAMRSGNDISQVEVMDLASQVTEKSRALRNVGLLDKRSDDHESYLTGEEDGAAVRQVVATILRSTLERFRQLDDEHQRLHAFKSFLDKRLLGKSLVLGGRRGMVFESDHNRLIRPEHLSSGEQHLVILAFDLLYATASHSLAIIDEPEISLHVAWQDSLIEDFVNLGSARDISFLMASHAPAIIAQMPDCEFPVDF